MVKFVVGLIFGFFILKVLPRLIFKRKKQTDAAQYFVLILFKITGITIIVFSILNFIRFIFS